MPERICQECGTEPAHWYLSRLGKWVGNCVTHWLGDDGQEGTGEVPDSHLSVSSPSDQAPAYPAATFGDEGATGAAGASPPPAH